VSSNVGKDGMFDKYLSKNLTDKVPENGDIKPSYLSTYEYMIQAKKEKRKELLHKQGNENFKE
jgi:hypothetical protein